jgi:hypothetical protein
MAGVLRAEDGFLYFLDKEQDLVVSELSVLQVRNYDHPVALEHPGQTSRGSTREEVRSSGFK